LTDPRAAIIQERMKEIKRIIAVSSGKGGVGKSLVSSTLALALAKRGYKVGLFDLDFTSPSTHLILGISGVQPKEDKGIVPPEVHGLKYMSITYYSGDLAAPLRGADVSNALLELLSVTLWGRLDFLVLDMPPGIGDVTLDLIRLLPTAEFLIVTTSSELAFETVKKLAGLLVELKVPFLGVVENMKMDKSREIRLKTEKLGLRFLTGIPYDPRIESALGSGNNLLRTKLGREIGLLASEI